MKRSNPETPPPPENGQKNKRERQSKLVESLTTPKQPSLFEDGIFTEEIDPLLLDTLLRVDVFQCRPNHFQCDRPGRVAGGHHEE